MFSWWVAPGEAEALEALIDEYTDMYPEVEVTNAAASGSDNARERLEQRFAQGFPPDTFQANGGHDLTRWVVTNGMDASQTKIEDLDWLYEEEGLYDVIPAAVIESVSYGGHPYAIPLNIHRNNSLFYNTAVLEEHGVPVPQTFEEFLAGCETMTAAGQVCLAAGAKDNWPLEILVWQNVMFATMGAPYHTEFFTGHRSPDDPELETMTDNLLAMWAHADPDAFETDWIAAVNKVGTGEAAYTVMGDWAKGLLVSQGLTPGTDFGQIAFPGTAGTFVFTTDSFPLALGAPERDLAVDLLRLFGSNRGQIAFNTVKGSIPTRLDASAQEFDVLGKQMISDFRDAQYRSLAGLAPPEFALGPTISDTLRTGDRDILLGGIRDFYDVLSE